MWSKQDTVLILLQFLYSITSRTGVQLFKHLKHLKSLKQGYLQRNPHTASGLLNTIKTGDACRGKVLALRDLSLYIILNITASPGDGLYLERMLSFDRAGLE